MNGQCSSTGRFLCPSVSKLSARSEHEVDCSSWTRAHAKGLAILKGRAGSWMSTGGGECVSGEANAYWGEKMPSGDEPPVIIEWERRPDWRSGSRRIHGTRRHHRNTQAYAIEVAGVSPRRASLATSMRSGSGRRVQAEVTLVPEVPGTTGSASRCHDDRMQVQDVQSDRWHGNRQGSLTVLSANGRRYGPWTGRTESAQP